MVLIEPVSQKWRDLQKQKIIPPDKSFIEIKFRVGNPEGQNSGIAATNGSEYFSSPQEIVDQSAEPIKYAMLEPGLWVLDGTYQLVMGKAVTPPSEYFGSPYVPIGSTMYVTSDGLVYNVKEAV